MAGGGFSSNNRGAEEQALIDSGIKRIAGVDEAGRGPLAGPVVAAAVVFAGDIPVGINDSKKLSEARREALYGQITRCAEVSVVCLSPTTIDALNIRGATLEAMKRALGGLCHAPDHALIDGRDIPPMAEDTAYPLEAIIGGDRKSVSIAAASIIAKVTRDRIMKTLDGRFPAYGFAGHKGYPTKAHRETLMRDGISPHHRLSYAPVAAAAKAAK